MKQENNVIPDNLLITRDTILHIAQTIGCMPPECGGIIGMRNGVACRFFFDAKTIISPNAYYPDPELLNRTIDNWADEDIAFCGVIHSHPKKQTMLSAKDIEFARAILRYNPLLNTIYFPIALSEYDSGAFTIIPYCISENTIKEVKLTIIDKGENEK